MKELPIIFTGTDPAKIRAGTKTQHRFIMKPQPVGTIRRDVFSKSGFSDAHGTPVRFRYAVGERRYVKEPWACSHGFDGYKPSQIPPNASVYYADAALGGPKGFGGLLARSAMSMPREFSRTLVEIVSVRAEWLQDISEADCAKEGAPFIYSGFAPEDAPDWRGWYRQEWERIHGPGSWALNPVVEAIEFKVVTV